VAGKEEKNKLQNFRMDHCHPQETAVFLYANCASTRWRPKAKMLQAPPCLTKTRSCSA